MPGDKLPFRGSLSMHRSNVITICEVLTKFLDGRPLEKPQLMPFSPIHGL